MDYSNITRDATDPLTQSASEPSATKQPRYLPLFELTRGQIVESIHYGAIAVVDPVGRLIASYGDEDAITYLRSSSKPLQAIPFIQAGGKERYHLTLREIALICASHAGTDEHMHVLRSLQDKVSVVEAELLCGTHPIRDKETKDAMLARGEEVTPNRHNCSGKHTGMLAYERMLRSSGESTNLPYTSPDHPVQREILTVIAEISGLPVEDIRIGVDGCSVPNFAMPLRNAALAFARLCDPTGWSEEYVDTCQTIASAMIANPDMVGGPDSFDTQIMSIASGRIISKGGAEGYLAMGLMPGAIGGGTPAMGIAIKISDGDINGRARYGTGLEVLRLLGGLSDDELKALAQFGPVYPLKNWTGVVVGEARPDFNLIKDRSSAVK